MTVEHGPGEAPALELSAIKPIRRGYEQVAEQLRSYIETGLLAPGTKLPPEEELAARFKTSRQTVREALRLLAAWNLVRSTVGRRGGTFVAYPDIEHITALIGSNVALLTAAESISLDTLLEVRELLEIPAAGLAAERADEQALEHVRRWLVDDVHRFTAEQQALRDIQFHIAVLEAARNPMLLIADQPLLQVLSANLSRMPRPIAFRRRIQQDHVTILDALEARDPQRARDEMRRHLAYLHPHYASAGRAVETE